MSDTELLQDYVATRSEAAFRELVERHLPLVFSAALRQTGNAALAEDVAQVVFIILSRKAGQLSSGTILAGWLFRTTRYTAAKAMRNEIRRRRREQEAFEMQRAQPYDAWERLAPSLDEALGRLNEADRSALLLHYFQNKRLREVGLALGTNEDAAQKRVSRAVEKLRKILSKCRVSLPVAVIPGLLMTHGAQAAPSYLASNVVSASLGQTILSASVFSLVKQVSRQSPWPGVAATAAKTAGLALVACLVIFYWPERPMRDPSALSFARTISPRTRQLVQPLASASLSRVTATQPAILSRPTAPPPARPSLNTVPTSVPAAMPAATSHDDSSPDVPDEWQNVVAALQAQSPGFAPFRQGAPNQPNVYPGGLNAAPLAPQIQPVFYPGAFRRRLLQPADQAQSTSSYQSSSPWMPAPRATPSAPRPAPASANPVKKRS